MNTLIVGQDSNGKNRPVLVNEDGSLNVGLTVGDIEIGTIGIDQETAGANEVNVLNFPADPATESTSAAILAKILEAPATEAKQDTGNSTLSTLNGKVTACNTGAVTVAASALPTGAATAAKQPALGTAGTASTDVITVQGIANGTAMPGSGTVTVGLASGTRVNSTAYEVSRVINTAACKLVSLFGYNSGPAQFIQLFDATSAPADGTAPVFVIGVPAQSSFGIDFGVTGLPFSTGCVASNSTTGPTRTAGSANCFFTAVRA